VVSGLQAQHGRQHSEMVCNNHKQMATFKALITLHP